MSQTCSIGEGSGEVAGQGRVSTARGQSRAMRVSEQWSSRNDRASRYQQEIDEITGACVKIDISSHSVLII
ncbi:hypothetical protein X975_18176, partial [Stegodyphus mimosarum]